MNDYLVISQLVLATYARHRTRSLNHTAERAVRVAELSRATGRGANRLLHLARLVGALLLVAFDGNSVRGTVRVKAGDRRLTICPTDYGSNEYGVLSPVIEQAARDMGGRRLARASGRPLAVARPG